MSVGVGDLSRTLAEPNSNLGLRDWKSESFESWTFFSLRVDSTKHDDCCADNQKKLAHAHLRSKFARTIQQGARSVRLCCARTPEYVDRHLIQSLLVRFDAYHFPVWRSISVVRPRLYFIEVSYHLMERTELDSLKCNWYGSIYDRE